jgi:pimeloyl-ACP methyl ester carboxylesterase
MNKAKLKKIGWGIFKRVAALCILVPLLLLGCQHAIIYHERPYRPSYQAWLPSNGVELRSTTKEGRQLSFYVPPQNRTLRQPKRLWVLFPGNASLALDWADFIQHAPDKDDGFLLIEYPGYGDSEGSASPKSIDEAAEAAFDTLAAKLGVTPAELNAKVNIIGLSLGSGAALNFSTRHPPRRMILIAPFTSLRDCARRLVGFPLHLLLRHNFDNRARLAELAAKQPTPTIAIFHGSEDITVPSRMGRELADLFPQMITFHEIQGSDHNSVIAESLPYIYGAMEE